MDALFEIYGCAVNDSVAEGVTFAVDHAGHHECGYGEVNENESRGLCDVHMPL